jgi:hypothetical protein
VHDWVAPDQDLPVQFDLKTLELGKVRFRTPGRRSNDQTADPQANPGPKVKPERLAQFHATPQSVAEKIRRRLPKITPTQEVTAHDEHEKARGTTQSRWRQPNRVRVVVRPFPAEAPEVPVAMGGTGNDCASELRRDGGAGRVRAYHGRFPRSEGSTR